MTKIFKNILFVLVIVLLSVAIICTVGLRLLGFQFRAVLSGSMEPELPVGAMLLVKSTPFEQIHVGDDITFVRDKNLTVVTHRVISIDEENQRFTTQGLSNNTADAPVGYENVLGTVQLSIPHLGYIISFITSGQGRIIVITAIVALVIVWLMLGYISKKREKKQPKEDISAKENQIKLGSWLEEIEQKKSTT